MPGQCEVLLQFLPGIGVELARPGASETVHVQKQLIQLLLLVPCESCCCRFRRCSLRHEVLTAKAALKRPLPAAFDRALGGHGEVAAGFTLDGARLKLRKAECGPWLLLLLAAAAAAAAGCRVLFIRAILAEKAPVWIPLILIQEFGSNLCASRVIDSLYSSRV
jgi:hypothetical protein